jgi:hypothetical protein
MGRVNRVEDENIIIITNNVELTADVVEENRVEMRRLMNLMDGPVVFIIDYRDVKTSFGDILNIMRGNQQGKRKDINERSFTMFVGHHKLTDMYRDAVRQPQYGGIEVPTFNEMEEALHAARLYIEGQSKGETA